MSKQAIRTTGQANNYVAPTIEKYAKRRFGVVAGLGVLALTASLTGCPSREEVKKPPAQIVDGGRMSDGSQQAAVKPLIQKPTEEKKEGEGIRQIEVIRNGKKVKLWEVEPLAPDLNLRESPPEPKREPPLRIH